jgi:glyoxylase-like metal-dependent hydrolase (beta-lactamase superfamily II)
MINRRQFLTGLASALVFPRIATSQSSGIAKLNNTLSLVNGVGTNVLALTTRDGVVLVDSGAPEFGDMLMKHLAGLAGSKRVQTVFNTHFHLENTGSNEMLGKAGARILAHENTREWMAIPYWLPAEDRYQKPRPKAAHPTETFYTTGSLKATTPGAEQIDYGYLIDAHTSGDIYVFFRDSNVLAVGDVASPRRDPELDYFTGAWIGGRVDAMDRLLKLSDDKTRIVPGYGPLMSHAELKAERDMMAAIYDRTVDRVREGDSAEDMLKAGVMNDLARTFHDPGKFLYDVHKGLWAHHNKLAPNVV